MDSITRDIVESISDEYPGAAIHVFNEFLGKREATYTKAGYVPSEWDGTVIEICWPGGYCAIKEG